MAFSSVPSPGRLAQRDPQQQQQQSGDDDDGAHRDAGEIADAGVEHVPRRRAEMRSQQQGDPDPEHGEPTDAAHHPLDRSIGGNESRHAHQPLTHRCDDWCLTPIVARGAGGRGTVTHPFVTLIP